MSENIKLIGKSILGERGFSQNPSKMEPMFGQQLVKIDCYIPSFNKEFIMTSMTGSAERSATNGAYFPKIRKYNPSIGEMFDPEKIYDYCKAGLDKLRPGCDFIVWDEHDDVIAATFSREAPIIAFESSTGKKALGVILRPSFMKYGDYLFSTMKEYLGGKIKVTLVTCNHYEYSEGSIPSLVQNLALRYDMSCFIGFDSEKDEDCYHRGEDGNHVVAMW